MVYTEKEEEVVVKETPEKGKHVSSDSMDEEESSHSKKSSSSSEEEEGSSSEGAKKLSSSSKEEVAAKKLSSSNEEEEVVGKKETPKCSSVDASTQNSSNEEDVVGKKETPKCSSVDMSMQKEPMEMEKKPPPSLFSEEDEAKLLIELKDFWEKQGMVKNDWINFCRAIKGQLSQDYSKSQISEKIRRLKYRFKKNYSKESPLPLDDGGHEARVFQLSKSLWENDPQIQISSSSIKNRKRKKEYVAEGEHLDPLDYPLLRTFFNGDSSMPEILKNNWILIGSETAKKLEKQWGKIFQKKLGLNLEEIDFTREVSGLILDQLKRT